MSLNACIGTSRPVIKPRRRTRVEAKLHPALANPAAPRHHTGVKLLLTLLATLGAWQAASGLAATNAPSLVVVARDAGAVHDRLIDADKTRALVTAGITALTGQTNEIAAWREFFSSNDVVGIKISTLAAPLHVTHREVIDAIAAGLASAGVARTNIIVWDRDPQKMRLGDWKTSKSAYRLAAVIGDTGWDTNWVYDSRIAGKLIWGDLEFGREEALGTHSHLPILLTQTITKLINVPVLMDHDPCGLAGCLYNISLGMVDNTRRFEQFGYHGEIPIAEIAAMKPVRDKLVLNVMDALVAGYAGGPAFKPQYSFAPGALYFSRDPVAVDAVCLALLEARRKEANIPAIASNAWHIAAAAQLQLGQADTNLIHVVEVNP